MSTILRSVSSGRFPSRRGVGTATRAGLALAVLVLASASCGSSSGGDAASGRVTLAGRVVAGAGLAAARLAPNADTAVVGITVTAEQDGTVVDTALTDVEGRFELAVSPVHVTLHFTATGFDVSLDMTVPDGSTVSVTITLTSSGASLGEGVTTRARLSCDHGALDVDVGDETSLVVDGGGDACILATGNCAITVRARDVTLTGCDRCVDARGTANVQVAASGGELVCQSSGDGVSATGNATVALGSDGPLTIDSSNGTGIAAGGNSRVTIASSTGCGVSGAEGAISPQGNAGVDTGGCAVLDASP